MPKKKSQRFLKPTIFLFLFLSFLYLGIWFLKSSFFKVKFIDCQAESLPCKPEIFSLFDKLRGKNIFLLKFSDFKRQILVSHLLIKEINFSKKLPDKVLIGVSFRRQKAAFSKDKNQWFLVDEEGFIFEKTTTRFLPLVLIKESLVLGEKVGLRGEKALELLNVLNEYSITPKFLEIFEDDFSAFLESSIATFSAEKDFDPQVASLQLILSKGKINGKMPKVVDLRFDKPIVLYR